MQDGYSGGSYTNCSDTAQPEVAPIVNYLKAINVSPNCQPGAYYLLNNYVPAYIGSGATDPTNTGPFTLPPVKQHHIGDVLSAKHVSWGVFRRPLERFQSASLRPRRQLRQYRSSVRPSGLSLLQHLQSLPLFDLDDDERLGA